MSRVHALFGIVAVAAGAWGCGSGEVTGGAGPSGDAVGAADDYSDGSTCTDSSECDDGLYCNGEEKCERGYCRAGHLVACDDGVDCTRDACDETGNECQHTPNHASCDEGLCDPERGCGEGQACVHDDDCDDDDFCNGVERCGAGGGCERGEPIACDDGNDCTLDQCSEQGRVCTHEMRDADGDGHADAACRGGDDCDDDDRGVRPGSREVCDDGFDNDCDRQRDCSDPQCEDSDACLDDDERLERDRADRADRDDDRDRDDRDDRADRDGRDAARNGDPCVENGWYNDGDCDNVCLRRDPDCDRDVDACEDRRWYRDNICDDACRRQDPDCPARGDDACRYANDGVCDEPSGNCAAGTDTTDCRPNQARRGADTCRYANDGTCDERTYCTRGTDGRDCTDGGPNSCYWANDGHCDQAPTCLANTDRNDCGAAGNRAGNDADGANRDARGAGVCGGLTYQGRCQDSHTVEFCLDKGTANERRQVNTCAAGRECRWQNAQTGYTCLAPDAGGDPDDDDAGSSVVPAGWTCSRSYYDAGDDCDCDCGAYDPDCDSPELEILNCEDGQTCDDDGECTGAANRTVPQAWSCDDAWYDADDGCDCNCGILDPDCNDANATLYHCDEGQVCNASGHCVAEDDADDDECWDWDSDCDDEEEDEDTAPAGWTCLDSYYDAGDGCDCECGVRDPDCNTAGARLYGCEEGEVCGANGACESEDEEEDDVPFGWTCQASYFDAGDGCDCDCGAHDPDCDDEDAQVYGCELGETCSYGGMCVSDGSSDDEDVDPDESDAPAGWECNDSYYDAGDGCDCDCGAYDPDCDDPDAQVFGCTQGQSCGYDGSCVDGGQWV